MEVEGYTDVHRSFLMGCAHRSCLKQEDALRMFKDITENGK